MDNRPIGFFDSGLGGLTCIPHLMRELPGEKVIYFGDTARTPYGSKAVSTIRKFSLEIADFLVKNDVKMIVIACNTVSATSLWDIRMKYPDIPVIGIIDPAAEKAANICTSDDSIGVIGTKATITSGAYNRSIKSLNRGLRVYSAACPAFVPLIEEGIIDSDIMDLTIKYYLDDFIRDKKIDNVIFGCTHYPFIRGNFERLYPGVKIIDPSYEIVFKIRSVLEEEGLFARETEIENTCYASDLAGNFVDMIERVFENIKVNVKFKNLEL